VKRLVALAVVLALGGPVGCYRTHYKNVAPPFVPPPSAPAVKPPDQSWMHFFLFGWIPGERRIDAAEQCGGAEHIEAIETERRFIQGVIAIFASYYINIYSPWTGRVLCDNEPAASPPVGAATE